MNYQIDGTFLLALFHLSYALTAANSAVTTTKTEPLLEYFLRGSFRSQWQSEVWLKLSFTSCFYLYTNLIVNLHESCQLFAATTQVCKQLHETGQKTETKRFESIKKIKQAS